MVFLKWPKQQRHHEDHYSQSRPYLLIPLLLQYSSLYQKCSVGCRRAHVLRAMTKKGKLLFRKKVHPRSRPLM